MFENLKYTFCITFYSNFCIELINFYFNYDQFYFQITSELELTFTCYFFYQIYNKLYTFIMY